MFCSNVWCKKKRIEEGECFEIIFYLGNLRCDPEFCSLSCFLVWLNSTTDQVKQIFLKK